MQQSVGRQASGAGSWRERGSRGDDTGSIMVSAKNFSFKKNSQPNHHD